MRSKLTVALIAALVMSMLGGGYAVADALITGKKVKNGSLTGADLKNGSVTNKDMKKGSLRLDKLSKGTQALIRKKGGAGATGKTGAQGPQGPQGPGGTSGAGVGGAGSGGDGVVFAGPNWGTIFRNTIGSPDIDLAGGPNVPGANGTPPFGIGSLAIQVAGDNDSDPIDDREAASFGNEVDFAGKPFNGLNQLGFQVFTTDENNDRDNPGRANLPNISIEVDPNLALPKSQTGFSTLVFQPAARPASEEGRWSGYIDATNPDNGNFRLTGAAGNATGCNQATPCEFADLKTALNDGGDATTVFTVAVAKGRDFAFQGAVDGLRVGGLGNGDQTFDFEPFGTSATP